jgi:serine/threonine-protein kinase
LSKTKAVGGASPPLDAEEEGAGALEEVWSKPGVVLGGRFVVERRLGSGGMGYVVAARHPELEERVAIKLLRPGRALSEEARTRLVREARAAARIRSAHVVRIFDVVSQGAGAPYVVMEYLAGETLAQLLARTGRLPVERAVEIVVQSCEPVAEAHRNGTIHRDLKPSNLFLTTLPGRACFVKVLDFGIAKTREGEAAALTQSQALLASPAYASPEQLRASKEVDERADIWSLGVILYECLTGRLPFGGRGLAELSSEILRDAPQPPSAHRKDLPVRLERTILRCLEKEPTERFENVEALVSSLQSFAPSAAAECLEYVRDLGPKSSAPAASSDSSFEPSQHPSTLTHASVASATGRPNSKRTNRWLLGLLGVPVFLLIFRSYPAEKSALPAATPATTTAAADRPPDLPTPTPSVTSAHERSIISANPLATPALVPLSGPKLSDAAPRTRPTTALARERRPVASASAVPVASPPSALEALPLNDLIDGRK